MALICINNKNCWGNLIEIAYLNNLLKRMQIFNTQYLYCIRKPFSNLSSGLNLEIPEALRISYLGTKSATSFHIGSTQISNC